MTIDDTNKKKKESIVDLSRFIDKSVRIKLQGGREGFFVFRLVLFFI